MRAVIGDPCALTDGRAGRVRMVLSLQPATGIGGEAALRELVKICEEAAEDDPDAAAKRAAGRAVGLKVAFEVDPEDVRDYLAGKRTDLKTYYLCQVV